MPRYYFDALDGFDVVDDVGEMLPDLGAARTAAAQVASELTADRQRHLWAGETLTIRIRTDGGVVGSITVSTAPDNAPGRVGDDGGGALD